MRYGSIPDGNKFSMTHLEYIESQKCELPALIYILDEETQPVLPKFVETGPGAESLKQLKELLRKTHTVSEFTTPEDLSAKILHDIPNLLPRIGVSISESIPTELVPASKEIPSEFHYLPKMVKGRKVEVKFYVGSFSAVAPEECGALNLELGATISKYHIDSNNNRMYIYASNEIAQNLINLPRNTWVTALTTIVYGTSRSIHWGEDGPVEEFREHQGVHIDSIIEIIPPMSDSPESGSLDTLDFS